MLLEEDNQLTLDDLENLIPKDHLCYFVESVVNQIDCPEENTAFIDRNSDTGYSCKLLLRLILMSIFDGGLSAHEIERRTNNDIFYMYLARMETPCFKTIAKFKSNFHDLIFETFKRSIELADENVLIKIHQFIDNPNEMKSYELDDGELKILNQNLNESIEVDKNTDTECF